MIKYCAMNNQESISGTFPFRFLKWFCPPHLYEAIEGDLIQRFQKDWKKYGEKKGQEEDRVERNTILPAWNSVEE